MFSQSGHGGKGSETVGLPKFEIFIYFMFWLACIMFSMGKVYTAGKIFLDIPLPDDFAQGWSIIGRRKDTSDYEWDIWFTHLKICIPWFAFHVLLTRLVRYISPKAVALCCSFVTFAFLAWHYTPSVLFSYIGLVFILYGVLLFHSEPIIWITSILLLLAVNSVAIFSWESMSYENNMLVRTSVGWFILRAIDFMITECGSENEKFQILKDMLGYTFYFPSFHLGPFLPYSEFKKTVCLPNQPLICSDVYNFLWSSVKYIGWILILEIASHYFYCNAMHFYIHVFSNDLWVLNGIGYCMGQFFYMKYFVIYGIIGAISKLENYDSPPPPRCIHRVHMYSDMWRHFDRGFYLFIFRRIYKPICGHFTTTLLRKLWASFLSFSFVYIWHGVSYSVFFWSLFNFLGVTLEAIGRSIGKMSMYRELETKYLSERNRRRFHSIICAPLWVLAVISNFIFFGGHDMGFLYFKQFLSGSWKLVAVISTVSYCMCQVSVEMNSRINNKKRKNME